MLIAFRSKNQRLLERIAQFGCHMLGLADEIRKQSLSRLSFGSNEPQNSFA